MATIKYRGEMPALPEWAAKWLSDTLDRVGIPSCEVTETERTPERQAVIMFNMVKDRGEAYARRLYGSAGDQVVDVLAQKGGVAAPDRAALLAAMSARIRALGGSNVSHHIPTPGVIRSVFDVAPSSLGTRQAAFQAEVAAQVLAGVVSKLIPPPGDPAFHIELLPDAVLKARGQGGNAGGRR